MAEPSRRRQRPDSSKMWEESENRGPARDRDEKNERGDRRDDRNRNHDRNHDRSRRDRSRSPRDSRDSRRSSYRDRERDRGGRSDDRSGRGNDRNRDYRDERSGKRDGHRADVPDRTRGEFIPDALSQTVFALRGRPNIGQDNIRESREKDEDRNGRKGMFSPDSEHGGTLVLAIRTLSNTHKDNERSSGDVSSESARSRSPRRSDERDYRKDKSRDDTSRRREYSDDQNITPQPVSFSIGASHTSTGQDHDRMDIDGGNKKKKKPQPKKKIEEEEDEDDDEIVIEDDGMAAMQAMMGFGGFGTTQNKKVPGNNVSAVRKEKKTEYRQYMNRVGGFNRPLSPSRD
ncbi:hypothetical protein NHQ30_010190 [Ciborinia camelliae]|nr:hypothetical protein NHQ30_010190 [Ciborinia camelliae]